jgi:cell wall-associated NlpC family hydrolase
LLLLFALLPGRAIDRSCLRQEYVASLRSFEGCRYVWGGENRLGIDCSGLVRAGLINASFRNAVVAMNPALLRFALDLWWHDCSAKALGEEYRQQTLRQFSIPDINGIDPVRLQPGDLAVTRNGVHIMAYLGNSQWIEADPGANSVLVISPPSDNSWFESSMNILRWRVLDESSNVKERR